MANVKEKTKKKFKPYTLQDDKLNQAVKALVNGTGEPENADLMVQMMTTALKLHAEKVDRGDLKILNSSLKELRWAFRIFRPYRHIPKVSVFGSARTRPRSPSFKAAVEFSRLMVESGWMIVTGGSSGIMYAGNEGAGRAHSFGANIRLPFEQDVNPVIHDDRKLINFKYFFTRKLIFVKESNAICLFPGGFGTLDEGFEALTLLQTGKMMPRPIVLVEAPRGTYWKKWLYFVKYAILKHRMIDPSDLNLFTLVHSPAKARDIIIGFYKNYHSVRFAGGQLVIRLKRELTNSQIKQLNRQYKTILTKGTIRRSDPLAAEINEPETLQLPRIALHFDRKSFSRLKMMVETINKMGD